MKDRIYNNFELLLFAAAEQCAQEDAAGFLSLETTDVRISQRTHRQIRRIIGGRSTHTWHFVKVALVACLICISLAFSACMAIPKIRTAIYNVIIEWYNEYVGISFGDPNEASQNTPTGTLASVQTQISTYEQTDPPATEAIPDPPTTIESKAYPTYLPGNYTMEVDLDNIAYYITSYYNESHEWKFCLTQTVINGDIHLSDNEYQIVDEISINDNQAVFLEDIENSNMYGLVWQDGYYEYTLYGIFNTREDIVKIAQSIKFDG